MEKQDTFNSILTEIGLNDLLEKIYQKADSQRNMIKIIDKVARD